jgi:hypothetical protein
VLIHNVVVATVLAVFTGVTVKFLTDEQPVDVSVKVKLTTPALTPVTKPPFVMVATPVLLLVHVPPVVGLTLATLPIHTDVEPPSVGAPGIVLMITFALGADVQVFVFVTVNVYVAPDGNPLIVVLTVFPVVTTPPGD